MKITDTGVPIDNLVDAVKAAVKQAGISTTNTDRQIRVASIQLTLNAIATTSGGAKLEFKIPFIGMNVKLGTTITTKDTHTIDITLVPPDLAPEHEIRDGDVDHVLVDAIDAITATAARAGTGDDPFLLKESTVELTFAITDDGSISLGLEGETKDEATHKLKITLAPK
jgi:NTP-dependent ternary system trypsin peptidase co-occuring protein